MLSSQDLVNDLGVSEELIMAAANTMVQHGYLALLTPPAGDDTLTDSCSADAGCRGCASAGHCVISGGTISRPRAFVITQKGLEVAGRPSR